MAFEKLSDSIKGLSDNTEQFVITNAEYYKLSLFKNAMQALIGVAILSVRGIFGLLCLCFISVGLAFYIGDQLESLSIGFFIVGGVYLLLFLLIFFFASKPMEKMLLEKYSKMAFSEDAIVEETSPAGVKTIRDENVQ